MHDLTAPHVADTFGDLVALVERYGLVEGLGDWTVAVDPTYTPGLDPRAVVRWDRLAIVVRDLGDLDLARFVAAERVRARHQLRRDVMRVVEELGLEHPRRFLWPADRVVNAGLTRCPRCGTNVRAGQHRPGSLDCDETRRDRLASIADE